MEISSFWTVPALALAVLRGEAFERGESCNVGYREAPLPAAPPARSAARALRFEVDNLGAPLPREERSDARVDGSCPVHVPRAEQRGKLPCEPGYVADLRGPERSGSFGRSAAGPRLVQGFAFGLRFGAAFCRKT